MRSTSNPTGSDPGAGNGVRPRALILAVLVSAAVVLSAPFLGQLRGLLRSAFPGHFVAIVGGSVAVAVVAALAFALARVRDRKAARYGAIAAAVAVAAAYSAATRTGFPDVDAVERVHFVEYGAIAYLFYRAWRGLGDPSVFILPVLAGLVVGTCDEWLQWFIPNRVGEARDVFLNLVALACGLTFGAGLEPPTQFTWTFGSTSRRVVAAMTATLIVVFAAFVNAVHLGYVVTDPAVGAFRSHYTPEELLRLSADRIAAWTLSPPLVLKRLSREDQYLDEGLWHIRDRNEAWAAERYDVAWLENEILEKYFAPVIDTKTYAVPEISRWPAEQKATAQERSGTRIGFVSEAEPYPILAVPKWQFWAAVVAFVLAVGIWGRTADVGHRSSRAQENKIS